MANADKRRIWYEVQHEMNLDDARTICEEEGWDLDDDDIEDAVTRYEEEYNWECDKYSQLRSRLEENVL